MNNLQVTGTIELINATQVVSEKFKKRDFVLLIQDGNYPQYVKFQSVQDRCELLDHYKAGEEVIVNFNLKGRPFEKDGKTMYFTNLEAWKVQKAGQQQPPAPQQNVAPPPAPTGGSDIESNNLPF